MNALTLIPGQLSLSQLRDVYSQPLNITLDESAFAAIDDSVAASTRFWRKAALPTVSTPVLACWRRRASQPKIWKTFSDRWCCRTRRGLANRWMMTLRV